MFDKWLWGWRDRPRTHDERLTGLLHEWRAIEPRANFEAAVWRRIRTAAAPEPQAIPAFSLLREWLHPRTAWVSAMAAALGILVGVWAGVSARGARNEHQVAEPLLHPQTLAGSYLAMVTGDAR